jgi:hypothetical protein
MKEKTMASIDVRESREVTRVYFAASCNEDGSAVVDFITNVVNSELGVNDRFIYIENSLNGHYATVRKEDVKHLIKALEKAVEIGWDK